MEAAVHRAKVTTGCLASALHAYATSPEHAHAVVHVPDYLKGSVDAGGFGEGFHEGTVPFIVMDYLENILVSTVGIASTEAQRSSGIGCIDDMTSYLPKVLTGGRIDRAEFSFVVIETIIALFPASVVFSPSPTS